MRKFVPVAAFLAVLACVGEGQAEQVTLQIANVQSDDEGWAITRALARLPDVKVAQRVTKEKPTAVVAFDAAKADLGDLARAVAQTETTRRDKFAATLIVSYKPLDATAAADEAVLRGLVEPAFAKLQGVDVKGSKLDAKAKEIRIQLDGKGGAKLANIKAAFPSLALKELPRLKDEVHVSPDAVPGEPEVSGVGNGSSIGRNRQRAEVRKSRPAGHLQVGRIN